MGVLARASSRMPSRRLPGFRFEAPPPPPADVLPRMDIAAFVGFAASGPLHMPVAIEDPRRFAEIFFCNSGATAAGGDGAGPGTDTVDLPLAWNTERGEWTYGYLGPAVRSFLRNGGRRCWVVRVANSEEAETSRFRLPGILQVEPGPSGDLVLRPASLTARCPGSWADGLRVSTSLTSTAIVVSDFMLNAATGEAILHTGDPVQAGDVLRLEYIDDGIVGYVAVAATLVTQDTSGTLRTRATGPVTWFRRVAAEDLSGMATATWWAGPGREPRNTQMFNLQLRHSDPSMPNAVTLEMQMCGSGVVNFDACTEPRVGDFVRVNTADREIWMIAEHVIEDASGELPEDSTLASPPEPPELRNAHRKIISGQAVVRVSIDSASIPNRCELIQLQLDAILADRAPWRLRDLDFGPQAARYWGALPSDAELYELNPNTSEIRDAHADLWRDASAPRFPLAGVGLAETGHGIGFSFPFVPPSSGFFVAAGDPPGTGTALHSAVSALMRDGLSRQGSDLFLDPALAGNTLTDLLSHADDIRYIAPITRSLQGIHAVLAVDEVTLVAVPDALQRPWKPGEGPALETPKAPEPKDEPIRPEWRPHPCPGEKQDEQASQAPAWGEFLAATVREVDPPVWTVGDAASGGVIRLDWDVPSTLAPSLPSVSRPVFTLQEATQHDFADARPIYVGTDETLILYGRSAGDYYFRLRVQDADGNLSNWSEGLAVRIGPPAGWVLKPFAVCSTGAPSAAELEQRATLLQVHRGLLRMCAARGDLFAVLALPEHYREDDAIQYISLLAPSADPVFDAVARLIDLPLGFGEASALSYGAVYHPWLIEQDLGAASSAGGSGAGRSLYRVPPEGAMCGLIAARAYSRGAWVAPAGTAANQTLAGVVALTPHMAPARWLDLQQAQINILRQEPTGFVTLSADTLAQDYDVLQINVRRLLQLLRRMAQRMGPEFVFEPQGDAFQRLVRRQVEAMLRILFDRGAFAGATPESSYAVAVRSTPQDMDEGRFIVELRVAPSLPMTFLTVRLVQTGGRIVVTEEQ
jgi:hypothetical protein